MLKRNKKILIGSILVLFVFSLKVNNVFSATLYFSPPSGTFLEGDTFKVSVFLNTNGVSINGVDSSVSFPSNFLEAVSVEKSQSIFSMWVQEPKINSDSISFVGGVPSPGYNGSSGKIFDINFKAKKTGDASLFFPEGVVMANDGLGTNVLKSSQSATFAIKTIEKPIQTIDKVEEIITPETEDEFKDQTKSSVLTIKSLTHPDSSKWYADNNPSFTWTSDKDIQAVKLVYSKSQNSKPSILYEEPITEKQLSALPDGEYFFHVQIKTDNNWQEPEIFGFKIDTLAPKFIALQKIEQPDKTWPYAKFKIDASDELSGVDHFEIKINEDLPEIWQDDGTNIYQTKILNPGENKILFKVFDKAGNYSEKTINLNIEPLNTPQISEYPKEVNSNEVIVVRGLSYPYGQVLVWVQKDNNKPESILIQNNQKGEFVFVSDKKILGGVYRVWFEAVDNRGSKSLASETITIIVKESFLIKTARQVLEILTVLVPIISMVLVMVWIIWKFFSKLFFKDKKVRKNKKDKIRVIQVKDEDI